MAAGDAQEKTEDATPKRRLDARKKGTVAKSTDLTSSLGLIGALLVAPSAADHIFQGWISGFQHSLKSIPNQLTFPNIANQAVIAVSPAIGGFFILLLTVLVLGVATSTAQVGFVLSGEALNPSFAKLNPLEGFKRLFSITLVFEALKSLAKSLLFGAIAYATISSNWGHLIGLGYMTPHAGMQITIGTLRTMSFRVAIVWLALAGFDYFMQRKRIDKQLKMSKDEVKQEMKQMEQSPELKMAMAIRRRKLARGRMMDAVKTADVIITNPTHFAVAIQYDSKKSTAPIVVAKGADLLAAKIRELANANEIPIIPNPPLARTLYRQCEIGDTIPRDLFQPVAEVLAFVYRTIRKVREVA